MKEDKSIFLKVDCVEPVYYADNFTLRASTLKGVKVWIDGNGHFFECNHYTVYDPDAVREDGRRQVVELIKELAKMQITDKDDLFGYCTTPDILIHSSYDDVVEKLDAWKKEKAKIHIRDEVINAAGKKFVVTVAPHMGSNSVLYFSGIAKDGTVCKDQPAATYKKTGLHVDDLDAYLGV